MSVSFALLMNKTFEFSDNVNCFEDFFGFETKVINKKNVNGVHQAKRYLVDITQNKIHFILLSPMTREEKVTLVNEIKNFVTLYFSDQIVGVKWYTPDIDDLYTNLNSEKNMVLI
ncbi:hypothetical protein ACP8HI_04405 [Paenibacillus sp. FA6]|uniref:hypothetical protein n=1 Tax=Paenibacillus sp. FA6 TaxID=3413029 RepID=UPI003F65B1D1